MPGKNIADLGGHPVIAYSIAAALQAARVDSVMVSTDSETIRDIALAYGASVPFLRPAELAADDTRDFEVFEHALQWLLANDNAPDVFVQLRPTSPLRRPGLVDSAIDLLRSHAGADSVRSVCRPQENPYKMWLPTADGRIEPLLSVAGIDEPYNSPRQRLPQALWQTGAVDVMWTSTLTAQRSMTGSRVLPIMTERAEVVDIDTPADLERARHMLDTGSWVCPQ